MSYFHCYLKIIVCNLCLCYMQRMLSGERVDPSSLMPQLPPLPELPPVPEYMAPPTRDWTPVSPLQTSHSPVIALSSHRDLSLVSLAQTCRDLLHRLVVVVVLVVVVLVVHRAQSLSDLCLVVVRHPVPKIRLVPFNYIYTAIYKA